MTKVNLSPPKGISVFTETIQTIPSGSSSKAWFEAFFSENKFWEDGNIAYIAFDRGHLESLAKETNAKNLCFAKQKIYKRLPPLDPREEKKTIVAALVTNDFELYEDYYYIGNLFPVDEEVSFKVTPTDRKPEWTVTNCKNKDVIGEINFVWKFYKTLPISIPKPIVYFWTVSFKKDWFKELSNSCSRIIFLRGFVDLTIKNPSGECPDWENGSLVEILVAFGANDKNEILTDAYLPFESWPVKYPPYVRFVDEEPLSFLDRIWKFLKRIFHL